MVTSELVSDRVGCGAAVGCGTAVGAGANVATVSDSESEDPHAIPNIARKTRTKSHRMFRLL
jgi:hypothetical protein